MEEFYFNSLPQEIYETIISKLNEIYELPRKFSHSNVLRFRFPYISKILTNITETEHIDALDLSLTDRRLDKYMMTGQITGSLDDMIVMIADLTRYDHDSFISNVAIDILKKQAPHFFDIIKEHGVARITELIYHILHIHLDTQFTEGSLLDQIVIYFSDPETFDINKGTHVGTFYHTFDGNDEIADILIILKAIFLSSRKTITFKALDWFSSCVTELNSAKDY